MNLRKLVLLCGIILSSIYTDNIYGQVTGVSYQMRYDTVACRYDCYIIIEGGMATAAPHRAQFNAQYSIVMPNGVNIVGSPINHMPLQNNQSYTGTVPLKWVVSSTVVHPTDGNTYVSIVPTLSPTSFYNDVFTGDSIKIFSLNMSETTSCADGIRIYINGVDPDSSDPGMGGGDFSNGFTMGGVSQLYQFNAPQVLPPKPDISAITTCSAGIEIDLTATTSSCQAPLSYEWTGPGGYTGAMQDVAINPADASNNGTYMVTVTDAFGCSDLLSIDAISKPVAGADQDACPGDNISLQGSNPADGTWTADVNNPVGTTLTPGVSGAATVDILAGALGTYNFIYTNQWCSDTVAVTVTDPDAGPDPAPVNCWSQNTATMAATGTGTWSIGAGSAGTATITDPNNPTTTVNGFSAPGDYFLVWTDGACSDTAVITANDNCGCAISNNTLNAIIPSTYCGNSGAVNIDGEPATPAGVYLWEYSLDGGLYAAATGANTSEDYTTVDLGLGSHSFRRIYTTTSGLICSDTSNVVSFSVVPTPTTPINLTAIPNPVCLGTTVDLSVTDNPGATYTWTASSGSAGLIPSTTNTTTMFPVATGSYFISVTQTVNGCESPAAEVIVDVNPTPTTPNGANTSGTGPTVCGGTDGFITITGLTSNTTYTVDYKNDGTPVNESITSDGSGTLTIINLSAGSYTDFQLTNGFGCASGIYAGPVVLSDPNPPAAPANIAASPNPECLGLPITITVDDNPGAIFNWTASAPEAGLGSSTTNSVVMNATQAGFYTISVSQTVAGCTSPVASIDVGVNDAPPTPDGTTVSGTNPTVCGGTDGFITLSGLQNLTAYTVNYDSIGVSTSVTETTNTSGVFTITGLGEGTYANFSITNPTGCTSGTYPGPVNLSDPGAPSAPTNLTAVPNPACLGVTVNLSVDNVPGATYNWTESSPDAGLVMTSGNTTTMTATVAGTYTISVSQTVAGCTSPAATVDVEITVAPPTPNAGNTTGTNPTSCSGSDGFIEITGLNPGELYTVDYERNATPVSVDITADGFGVVLIPNLDAATYTNFILTNVAGCSSGTYAGPIVLSDPNPPAAPAGLAADPNPACLGETIDLSVTDNPNATYTWSVSPISGGLVSGTGSSTTMTPAAEGTFTVTVFQTVAGCVSPTATIDVVVNPVPPTPSAGSIVSNDPSVCGGLDGSFSISFLDPLTDYTLTYDGPSGTVMIPLTSDASGVIVVNNLGAGSYGNLYLTDVNICSSGIFAGPISLTDPGAPSAPTNLTGIPNPACLGETINLSVDNDPNATYNWMASSPDAGLGASTSNTASMTPTVAGTYTINVTQTVAGCTSPAAMIDIVVNDVPPTPDAGSVSSTDPTSCGVNDGTISFSGLLPNTNYTLIYTFDGGTPVNIGLTTNGSGLATLTNLGPGSYSDFTIVGVGDCPSGTYAGPVVLNGPLAPPAPTGLTAVPNPVCLGGLVNLSVNNDPTATYNWTASSPDAGLVASSTNATSMTATAVGIYTISVTQTIAGCTSPPATIDVEILPVPPTPDAGTTSGVDPSSCGATDGSISISGLVPGGTYDVQYDFNASTFNISLTADASGVVTIINLGEGSYSNFSITNASGCSSGTYAGPIVLSEPPVPSAPANLFATPNPVCLGETVTLTVTNNPGATYDWMITPVGGGLIPSTSNSTTMVPTQAGTYTISVTQTVSGCISAASTVQVLVLDDCLNPDFGVTFVDTLLTGDLSTNDKQYDGAVYGPVVDDPNNPSACSPNVNADGTYDFICSAAGEYEYLVDVCDPLQVVPCKQVPLVITVLATETPDNPPVANHDYTHTTQNNDVTINVLSNDRCQSLPNCILTSVTIAIPPVSGSFDENTMVYTPANNFVGQDSFRYSVCQTPIASPENCDEEWVYIEVYPDFSSEFTNGMDDYGQTQINSILTVDANDGLLNNDTDPQNINQEVGTQNTTVSGVGTLVLSDDGSYEFTPATDFVGPVDFPYEVCRVNSSICDSATLHLLVEPQALASEIGSYVWLDMDGDGRYDQAEPGIEGVEVRLFDMSGTEQDMTMTDATGYYQFSAVPADSCYLQFIAPPEYDVTFPNIGDDIDDSDVDDTNGPGTTADFEVVAGTFIENVKAGYLYCSKIGNNVWYDINENDIYDPTENGINGLTVNLWRFHFGEWIIWDTQQTGGDPNTPSGDGWYEFCAPPGTYYIEVVMPPLGLVQARPFIGGNPFRDSDINNANGPGTTNTFSLSMGQDKLDIGAGYYPMAIAGNLVWLDENFDGLQDSGEQRIAGVVVQAYDVETGAMVGESVTDDSGIYEIDYLEKRDIYLKFTPPTGLVPTFSGQGDDEINSDVDHSYGLNTTRMFSMQPGQMNANIDMGLSFGALPLSWLNVNVEKRNGGHLVTWKVSEEVNVKEYIVERMLEETQQWEIISTDELPANNIVSESSYSFLDKAIEEADRYHYRIKQVDFDGRFTYSKIVSINHTTWFDIGMYPNPTSNNVFIEYVAVEDGQLQVDIFDASGKLAFNRTIEIEENEGSDSLELDLADLPPGVYSVLVKLNNDFTQKKLVKIH